jgi:protein TonB
VPLTEVVPTDDGFWEGLTSGVPEGVLEGPFDYAGDTGSATGQVDAPVVDGPAVAGVDVAPPRKRHDVSPVYPPIAASARIEGTVVLEAVIDREGNVSNLRVVKSIPLLDNAALEAVRQWKYEPTRLNGRPVPVVMTVTLSFVLKR